MECKFNVNKCTLECGKYSLCSYLNLQKQITSIQEQLNFIYTTLGDISSRAIAQDKELKEVSEKTDLCISDLISILNPDS
jgi:hypothetical protein